MSDACAGRTSYSGVFTGFSSVFTLGLIVKEIGSSTSSSSETVKSKLRGQRHRSLPQVLEGVEKLKSRSWSYRQFQIGAYMYNYVNEQKFKTFRKWFLVDTYFLVLVWMYFHLFASSVSTLSEIFIWMNCVLCFILHMRSLWSLGFRLILCVCVDLNNWESNFLVRCVVTEAFPHS